MAPPSSSSSLAQSGQEEPLKRMEKIVTSLMARPDAAPFLEPVDWRGLELWDYPSVVKRLMDLGTIKRKLDRNQYETAAQCAMDVRQVWRNCMLYNAERSDFWLLAKALSKRFEDRYRKVKGECAYCRERLMGSDETGLPRGMFCCRFSRLYALRVTVYVGEEEAERDEEEAGEGEEDDEGDENESGDDEEAEFDDAEQSPESKSRSSSASLLGNTSVPTAPPALDVRSRLAANLLLLNGIELGHVVSLLEQKAPTCLEVSSVRDKMEINLDALDGAVFSEVSSFAAERASRKRSNNLSGAASVSVEDISNRRKKKK